MKKKIVFLTYHNWEAKRQGGFHKLAEYATKFGYEVVFFSFPRQFWTLLRKTDTFNFKIITKILKGITYKVNNTTINNRTILSLGLPIPIRFYKYFPSSFLNFFERLTIPGFKRYAAKEFNGADCFVFESTASVLLFNTIKELYPDSKIIYRPSDPLIAFNYGVRFRKYEYNVLRNSDIVFLVNQDGYNLYKKNFPDFDEVVNYKVLSNGVDIEQFKKKYPLPDQLKITNTALYVGARTIDWEMLLMASKIAKDINFIIVCPLEIPKPVRKACKQQTNIIHIKGIERTSVPQWVTNADLIIVPNPKNLYKSLPLGITAKYYQAIAAKKAIVSYHDTSELKQFDIPITYDAETFAEEVRKSIKLKEVTYSIDLDQKDWTYICNYFFKSIELL